MPQLQEAIAAVCPGERTSYEDGVLEVSLPKAAEVKPKKISVSAKKKEKTSK